MLAASFNEQFQLSAHFERREISRSDKTIWTIDFVSNFDKTGSVRIIALTSALRTFHSNGPTLLQSSEHSIRRA